MQKLGGMICLMTALMALDAKAQVTGSGTSGTIPVFTATGTPSTVGNSPIAVTGNNVGIGTTSPSGRLGLIGYGWDYGFDTGAYPAIGQLYYKSDGTGYGFSIGKKASSDNSYTNYVYIKDGGNVGIGTTSPGYPLEITANNGVPGAASQLVVSSDSENQQLLMGTYYQGGVGQYATIQSNGNWSNANHPLPLLFNPNGGNVGIGTTSPSQLLEVNGTAQIDGSLNVGSAGILFPDTSTPQTQPWTGVLCGGDYAESVDVSGDRSHYEPGDVLVIDPDASGKFLKSAEPYSTAVTGIYSTKPGATGRRQTTPKSADEVPMAMIGIVPTKVIAENGPIRPGDLLVTSSTMGYAMKGTDRNRMLGAVIGKAVGSLDSGTSVIEVVVTLQ